MIYKFYQLHINLLWMFIIYFCGVNAGMQDDWELKKEVDGIKAYTRKVEYSKVNEYKVEAEAQTDLASLVAILQDINGYEELFPDTKEAVIKYKQSDTLLMVYVHTRAPFPVRDRASVYRDVYSYDPKLKTVDVNIRCTSKYYQEKKGVIQIKNCNGSWLFKDIGNGMVHITHIFHADPGGSVPRFLVNKKIVDSPIETLRNLIEMTKKGKYKRKTFSFLN